MELDKGSAVTGGSKAASVDLFADGGVRVSMPSGPDRQLVSVTELARWVDVAERKGLLVRVTGCSSEALVAPVLEMLGGLGARFEWIEGEPAVVRKGLPLRRLADRFRRPSSLALACRCGAVEVVTDLLERGADPEWGGRPWRWACGFGNVETASAYQRVTGARSRRAPSGSDNAVVVGLEQNRWGRWFVLGLWLFLLLNAGVQAARGVAVTVAAAIVYGVVGLVVVLMWGVELLPGALPRWLAFEGGALWYRKWLRPWVGPIDLRQSEGVAALVVRDRHSPSSVEFVLVHEGVGSQMTITGPKKLRKFVGDRPRLTLREGIAPSGVLGGTSVIGSIVPHLPADIPSIQGTKSVLNQIAKSDRQRRLID